MDHRIKTVSEYLDNLNICDDHPSGLSLNDIAQGIVDVIDNPPMRWPTPLSVDALEKTLSVLGWPHELVERYHDDHVAATMSVLNADPFIKLILMYASTALSAEAFLQRLNELIQEYWH